MQRWLQRNLGGEDAARVAMLAGIMASVILTLLSFPPFRLGPVMFVALVPVFLALDTAPDWKSAGRRAWLYVFVGNAAICFWVAHTVREFAHVPAVVSYLSVAALSVTEHLAWPVVAALRHVLHRRYRIRPLLWTPFAVMALDVVLPKFFPDTVGHGLYTLETLVQVSDLGSAWLLTALVVASNEAVAALLLGWSGGKHRWPARETRRHAIAAATLIAAAFAYGAWRLADVRERMSRPSSRVRVALVQPNYSSMMKVKSERDPDRAGATIVADMLELSRIAARKEKPDLVVWPETAYPAHYLPSAGREPPRLRPALESYVSHWGIPLLFGGYDADAANEYNALMLLTPPKTVGGEPPLARYRKTYLLPISEYVPLAARFPILAEPIRRAGGASFGPGSGPTVFEGPKGVRLGATICLEGLYSRYARELARDGADVIANVANDSWFGPGMEPELHMELTRFRAIETRRPLIRSTNTGHSVVFDIDGSTRVMSGMNERTLVVDDVPVYRGFTSPYVLWGDLPFWLAGAWAALPFARIALARRKRPAKR